MRVSDMHAQMKPTNRLKPAVRFVHDELALRRRTVGQAATELRMALSTLC